MGRKVSGFQARPTAVINSVSFGATLGQNERILPQLLDPKYAESAQNYTINGDGRLESRSGLKQMAEKAGINGYSAGKYWYTTGTTDFFLVGYNTTVALLGSDGTVNDLKTNFTADVTDVEVYGDSAFVATGTAGEKLYRIPKATLTPAIESNAVACDQLFIKTSEGGGKPGVRLYCGAVDGDTKKLVYTATDTGAASPWSAAADWNTALTTPESAGEATFNDDITTITSRADTILVGSSTSRTPFKVTIQDVSGVASQNVQVGWQYKDHGMAPGAIDTSSGTYYLAPKVGLMRMTSANSEENVAINLGVNYFSDVNTDNATIVHDAQNNLILASYGKESTVNNETLAYNLLTGGITIFNGWNINIFMRSKDRVYGLSQPDGKMFLCFETFEDNRKAIATELIQEVSRIRLDKTSILSAFEIQAILFEGETIDIRFDIEDKTGGFIQDAQVWTITGTSPAVPLKSWGSSGFGNSGWGSGSGGATLTPQKYHTDSLNLEFISCKIRITANNKTPHTINFYQAKIEEGNSVNLNNITQSS